MNGLAIGLLLVLDSRTSHSRQSVYLIFAAVTLSKIKQPQRSLYGHLRTWRDVGAVTPVKLTLTRHEQGKYDTVVTRDDGVSYRLKGVAHTFAIPHDLVHFLVEKALNLRRGFWGSIADGAVFKSMSYIDGRRKPKAAERSDTLLKHNLAQLNEAEVLVRIFNDTIEQGHAEDSMVLQNRLRERIARPGSPFHTFSAAEISGVYAAYQDMLVKWRELPLGGELELRW
jgi:hypothetical protein